MDDLNLPIIKKETHKEKYLSMDDYLRFVLLNLRSCTDIKAARQLKKKMSVNVPFKLID